MTALPARDRREALAASSLNGIDFVEIRNDAETQLAVHFLTGVNLVGQVSGARISGGATIPSVDVLPFSNGDWSSDDQGRPVLALRVAAPGDFSSYTLALSSPLLDPYFSRVAFSFKARCPSTLDCEAPRNVCASELPDLPPIDYLAKDFRSFTKALSDFSTLRYPQWQERSEADFGVMFMEALASIADDLSYQQDRIAAEAFLDTASERRSLVRHARLVDYEPRPATAARVMLQFTVTSGPIPAGMPISAPGPDGTTIPFETGTGLGDTTSYPASPRWNAIDPYWWDDADRCLARGATEMWVLDEQQDLALVAGLPILLETTSEDLAEPSLREIVRLTMVSAEQDQIFGQNLLHLRWSEVDALRSDHDLTRTTVRGNLVPASQGQRYSDSFAIDTPPLGVSPALVRGGADGAAQYLHTLRRGPVAWLVPESDDGAAPLPELELIEQTTLESWRWTRRMLQVDPFALAFTLDPARYRPIGAPRADGSFFFDYDGGAGDTLRFGDGTFGTVPDEGSVFRVAYRVGGGLLGNVAADSITRIERGTLLASLATAVTNPFPAAGGADEESAESVRRFAPEAFRAKQFRAVRSEDYQAAVEELPWVQRAGTSFRHTGSWLTVFTTADPRGSESLSDSQRAELVDRLNLVRMAGYESYLLDPRFASLDIRITVCARAEAFRAHVEAAIREALDSARRLDGTSGLFDPDRFSFGQALERSALEVAVQNVPGVDGVRAITYRQRGVTNGYVTMPDRVLVGRNEIIRADNDPSRPEAGSIQLVVEGGK